jgi:hypothetical protein
MKKLVKVGAGILSAMPFLAFAQQANSTYIGSLIDSAKVLLDKLVIFLVALAVVWFIWNVIKYTMSSDEEAKSKAKQQMIWGVIAIAVIVSIWGLVSVLQNTFGVQTQSAVNPSILLPR